MGGQIRAHIGSLQAPRRESALPKQRLCLAVFDMEGVVQTPVFGLWLAGGWPLSHDRQRLGGRTVGDVLTQLQVTPALGGQMPELSPQRRYLTGSFVLVAPTEPGKCTFRWQQQGPGLSAGRSLHERCN